MRSNPCARLVVTALIGVLLAVSGNAASRQREPYTVAVEVDLVVINVHVLDKDGRAITGLTQNDFKVYEDGRLHELALFIGQDAPATIGLVVDSSASMAPRWPEVRRALASFVDGSNPEDEMFIVQFNENIYWPLPEAKAFTSDAGELKQTIEKLSASGRTALYDAIAAALDHLKEGRFERKF